MKLKGPKLTQCFSPWFGYETGKFHKSGHPIYKWHKFVNSDVDLWRRQEHLKQYGKPAVVVPCRECLSCVTVRRRQWQIRVGHEMPYHENWSFLTLTIAPENLKSVSLDFSMLTKFWKRLRHQFGHKIMYLACGEYGSKQKRPHFHAVVNVAFEDQYFDKMSGEYELYKSDLLDKAWQYQGDAWIGEVTAASVGYVIGYINAKLPKYQRESVDPETGLTPMTRFDPFVNQWVECVPEAQRQSTRPAFGRRWFDEYASDLFKGYLSYKGIRVPIPKTYMRWLEKDYPEEFGEIKAKHEKYVAEMPFFEGDSSFERLAAREKAAQSSMRTILQRS